MCDIYEKPPIKSRRGFAEAKIIESGIMSYN